MKLLYILGSYFPAQSGGPNNTIHWQAKYMSKEGVDVTVASLKTDLDERNIDEYNIKLNEKNNIEGVDAYYFDYKKNRYLSFYLYIWLFKNIKRFDFVQLTSYFFPISWFGAILCRIYNIPFSIAPRGELEENALKYSNKIKKLVDGLFLRKLFNKANFVMVTSKQELDFCQKFFHKDMHFKQVPNYIDISANKQLSNEEILQKKDILYLGRIHPKKGIENLIEAYINLDEQLKSKHNLLIVGSGSETYLEDLKNMVKDSKLEEKIKFLGHKQGRDKELMYLNSKIFVLPSYSENFGNVVLESLSFYTPVISSRFTPWEILEDEKCGSWIDNNPKEIKNKLEYYLNLDDDKYIEYSKNSFEFVFKKYDISQNIDNLIKVYNGKKNEKV